MSKLRLIIETPCCGDSGHRFLTSCAELSESDITSISNEANRTPVGRNYISVSCEVTQSLKNATVRTGKELIILHGIETGALESSGIATAQEVLRGFFASLRDLTDTIDWKSAGKSIVIVRLELLEWLDHLEKSGIPRINVSPLPDRPTQNLESTGVWQTFRCPLRWVVCIVVVLIPITIASVMIWKSFIDEPSPNMPPQAPSQSNVLQELAREWNCTSDELTLSLLRAANWDKREQVNVTESVSELMDGEVLAIIGKINATIQPKKFFVSPAVEGEVGFRRMFVPRVNSVSEARALRQWLFNSWQAFSNLNHSAIQAEKYLEDEDDEFAVFIRRTSNIDGDIGTGDGFREPKTPLFDRQDVMACQLLEDIHQALRGTGVVQRLFASNGDVTPDDFPSLLNALRKRPEEISKVIRESRKDVVDRVLAKGGNSKNVFAAYEMCEEFLLNLSRFDLR